MAPLRVLVNGGGPAGWTFAINLAEWAACEDRCESFDIVVRDVRYQQLNEGRGPAIYVGSVERLIRRSTYKPSCTGTMRERAKRRELGLGSEMRGLGLGMRVRVRAAAYNIEPLGL